MTEYEAASLTASYIGLAIAAGNMLAAIVAAIGIWVFGLAMKRSNDQRAEAEKRGGSGSAPGGSREGPAYRVDGSGTAPGGSREGPARRVDGSGTAPGGSREGPARRVDGSGTAPGGSREGSARRVDGGRTAPGGSREEPARRVDGGPQGAHPPHIAAPARPGRVAPPPAQGDRIWKYCGGAPTSPSPWPPRAASLTIAARYRKHRLAREAARSGAVPWCRLSIRSLKLYPPPPPPPPHIRGRQGA